MIRRTEHEIEVLREALDDEYHAWATYDQVITDFGEVAPFVNIREAEARHIEALRILYRGFGIPVPANNWPGRVARYPSLQAACEAGVVAEVANAELYDRLLAVPLRPEIATVLQKLRQASQDRHLPAFRRCAERQEVGGGLHQIVGPGVLAGGKADVAETGMRKRSHRMASDVRAAFSLAVSAMYRMDLFRLRHHPVTRPAVRPGA